MERLRDDLDGMLEDLLESYMNCSKYELAQMIVEYRYQNCSDDDIVEDWVNFCDGKVLDKPSDRMLRDYAMEYHND